MEMSAESRVLRSRGQSQSSTHFRSGASSGSGFHRRCFQASTALKWKYDPELPVSNFHLQTARGNVPGPRDSVRADTRTVRKQNKVPFTCVYTPCQSHRCSLWRLWCAGSVMHLLTWENSWNTADCCWLQNGNSYSSCRTLLIFAQLIYIYLSKNTTLQPHPLRDKRPPSSGSGQETRTMKDVIQAVLEYYSQRVIYYHHWNQMVYLPST